MRRTRSNSHRATASASSSASTAKEGNPAARQHHPLLDTINESTKWTVSAAVFTTLAARRDLICAWWVFGSILAAVLCRALKFALNEARPSTARKADPGMPSSHANSLGFLAMFVSIWAANTGTAAAGTAAVSLSTISSINNSPMVFFLSLGIPALGLFLTWLRVALGYHTVEQVAAGWLLGSSIAVGWWQLGIKKAFPILVQRTELQFALYSVTTELPAHLSRQTTKAISVSVRSSVMTSPPPLPRRYLGQTGLEVSVLGFGASPLGGVFQAIDESEGIASVQAAFNRGINFFDTSPFYGDTKSETVLGKGLKLLPRDQIIVATKIGRYGQNTFDFSAEKVNASIEESLTRLQLDYVDLLQCHDIEFASLDQIIEETLPALLKLKERGVVRNIGITGLPLKIYKYILDRVSIGTVDVVLSYCHHHLSDSTLETDLISYLKGKKVGIINASPLCMGLFTPQGPPEWHPAPPELKAAAAAAAAAAEAAGASLPKLALMHCLQNEDISTTLVGLCTAAQVNENCDAALHALGVVESPTAAEEKKAMEHVVELLKPCMNLTWPSGLPENN
ncbi:hypothetical protein KSW81_002897 [Nannochloris sp. 'desiccata']|nr:hypothetical protein KSW81_002897 [Chlorella desiccata (nom. nud.)]